MVPAVPNIEQCHERFSVQRKEDILWYWRKSRGRVLTHGVTAHEIAQWAILERKYGSAGLRVGQRDMAILRIVPRPQLFFSHTFRGVNTVDEIHDAGGMLVGMPVPADARARLLYLTVRSLTYSAGICTYPDLAHALWPAYQSQLPDSNIIKVLVCRVNKDIAPERLLNVSGRGYVYSAT